MKRFRRLRPSRLFRDDSLVDQPPADLFSEGTIVRSSVCAKFVDLLILKLKFDCEEGAHFLFGYLVVGYALMAFGHADACASAFDDL